MLLFLSAILTALSGVAGGGRAQARAEVAAAASAVAAVARAVVRAGRRPVAPRTGFVPRLVARAISPREPIWAGRRRI